MRISLPCESRPELATVLDMFAPLCDKGDGHVRAEIDNVARIPTGVTLLLHSIRLFT
ncbi:hypothetical protein D3C86_2151400 [compost metagenome]